MRRSAAVAVIIVAIVLAGGGTYLALHKSSNNTSSNQMANMSTPSSNSKSSSTPSATSSVNIENFAFSPANITVKKGTTVTWINKDSAGHTVTQDNGLTTSGPGLDSKVLNQGETYSATFNTTGTFKYHCSIHSNMTGTVAVTE